MSSYVPYLFRLRGQKADHTSPSPHPLLHLRLHLLPTATKTISPVLPPRDRLGGCLERTRDQTIARVSNNSPFMSLIDFVAVLTSQVGDVHAS